MLLALLFPLTKYASFFSVFNVFKYITFRAFGGAITSVLLSLLFGGAFINWLKRMQIGQSIRDDGPQSHLSKKGTPTMGGGLILLTVGVSTLLWGDLSSRYIWYALFVLFTTGALGWFDDYRKVVLKNSKGVSGKQKLFWQGVISLCVILAIQYFEPHAEATILRIPFFKSVAFDLSWMYVPFALLVIVGASNAVNLTDGLDGLAIGPIIISTLTFALFAYLAGHVKIAEYLQIPYVAGVGELTVFLVTIAGAGLGFLWYNSYPAQVFMGDVGSLSLGSVIGLAAVVTKHEILLVLVGGLFVIEAVSVIAQVASFKSTGKRIFKMAPLHHHFELKGWPEPKVIVRFWIISVLFAIIALSTLKLR